MLAALIFIVLESFVEVAHKVNVTTTHLLSLKKVILYFFNPVSESVTSKVIIHFIWNRNVLTLLELVYELEWM